MSQENMSKRIGNSPSPSIQRVIKNNTNVQKEVAVPGITRNSFNKQPVKVGGK